MSKILDFYEILGINKNASNAEIKKQYMKLIVKYHPDKSDDEKSVKMYELIQKAYEVLNNEKNKEDYDMLLKETEEKKESLKEKFQKFIKLQNESKNEDIFTLKEIKESITLIENDIQGLTKEQIESATENLILQREQDLIEFSQNQIFTKEEFNNEKFNAIFDYQKERAKNENKELTQYNDISTFNSCENMHFSNFDTEEKMMIPEIDKNIVNKIESAEYYNKHNKKEDNYNTKLEEIIKERENETKQLNNLNHEDFDNTDNKFKFLDEKLILIQEYYEDKERERENEKKTIK